MYTLSELIYKGLTETPTVTAIVGTKVFPLLVDQEEQMPYIVYHVAKNGAKITKDGGGDFTITILSYETTYNKALQLNEVVVQALEQVEKDNKKYWFTDEGATPLLDQEQNIYVQQIITIKKQ